MKRSLYHTYQMNLGTSCLLNRTIPKNLFTKWGALQSTSLKSAPQQDRQTLKKFDDPRLTGTEFFASLVAFTSLQQSSL